ncbi:hypothetical protein [Roseobacter sp.]|uniref:hypothetical protein n=1 Tax=Roseobacter sp. TaxID=1907202 RepID=UPI0032978E4E
MIWLAGVIGVICLCGAVVLSMTPRAPVARPLPTVIQHDAVLLAEIKRYGTAGSLLQTPLRTGTPSPGWANDMLTVCAATADLDNWLAARQGPEIVQYDAQTDTLALVWDDTGRTASEPHLELSHPAEKPDVVRILVNGETVADVHGHPGLRPADLTLIPLSTAITAGLRTAHPQDAHAA